MLNRDNNKSLAQETSSQSLEKPSVKKNLILKLLENQLLYFWNVYVWPNFSNKENRSDVHLAMKYLLQIKPGEKVLEVGSNMPMYQEYSKKVGEQGLFVALDLHLQIQKKAKQILQKEVVEYENNPFLEKLLTADGGRMPFTDAVFDVVVANNYNGDSMAMLEETLRVLKPLGRLGFSFSNPWEARKCYKICQFLGLEIGKIKSLTTESDSSMGTWVFVGVKR